MRRALLLALSFALFAAGAEVPRLPHLGIRCLDELIELAGGGRCGLEPLEPLDPDVALQSAGAREDAAREEIPT